MSSDKKFDIIVIGGGPGGYVAAIRAAQLGMDVALIEANHLGGICLNWGCIPTKSLLKSAEIYHILQNAEKYGFSVSNVKINFKDIIKRSRDVSKKLSQGIAYLLKKNNVTVFDGWGKLNGENKVLVTKDNKKIANLSAEHIILATGAKPRILKGFEPDGKLIWTYKEAMIAESLPKSLLVVGSGAIGMEFANFYHNLGTKVTVLEVADRILPAEDTEVSKTAEKIFTKQGIKIYTSAKLDKMKKNQSDVEVSFKDSKDKAIKEKFERVIMAVGIIANTENLGLEGTKVDIVKNQIDINEWCQTRHKGLYAIGDAVGGPWLAHKASHEAIICVEKIAGLDSVHPLVKENIPGCTYTLPQIASVGLSEDKAIAQGLSINVGRFPYSANGKAMAIGEEDGFVKTIFDKETGELIGAHIIGAEATEMIQGFVVGKTLEATDEDFVHTIFPHPTLSEMMHESVLDALDKVIHT